MFWEEASTAPFNRRSTRKLRFPSDLLVLSDHSMAHLLSFCPHLLSTCWLASTEHRESHSPCLLTSLSRSHCPARSPFPLSYGTHLPFSLLLPLYSYSLFPLKRSIAKFAFAHSRFWKNLHQYLRLISFEIPRILFPHQADQGSAELWPKSPPSLRAGFHFYRNQV